MKAVVYRIEEGLAVVLFEDQHVALHVPIEKLPEGTTEGSWLRLDFSLDEEQTETMYQKNKSLLEKLIQRGRKRSSRK